MAAMSSMWEPAGTLCNTNLPSGCGQPYEWIKPWLLRISLILAALVSSSATRQHHSLQQPVLAIS